MISSSDILLLGSGGWIPTATRETCSLYARRGSDVLLIDAGTGLRHLVERRELLEGVNSLTLLLTHFHLDHVVGLGFLPAVEASSPPAIWGPGEQLYGTPTREILERLLGPPFFGASLDSISSGIFELTEGAQECGPFGVLARRQPRHSDPTLAFRVGDWFTYCTDTAVDQENARFAEGSAVLLHEAWHEGDTTDDEIHSAAGDAGRIARDAEVRRLVLIHVNPLLRSDEALLAAGRRAFADTWVGTDLMPCNQG